MALKSVRLFSLFILLGITLYSKAQNLRIDGYKGIWYTIGQKSEYGDKYSGGLATYTANHTPVAIYASKVDKTFFVYGGTTSEKDKHLLIMISCYDHKSGTLARPVVVCDKMGVDDPHDNASLTIDSDGFIWVFVSGRNVSRLGQVYKSTMPYCIDHFEKKYQSVITYPQPWYIEGKGFIHLFTKYTAERTFGRELYWSTSPDGINWAPDKKLAGMGGHYQLSNVWKNKVVTVFNYHPDGGADSRTNVYLVQTEDMGQTWQTVDGVTLTTPLTSPQSAALVYDYQKENKLVYLNDLNFDKDGNPIILAVISKHYQPGPKGDPREWVVLHRKNGQWYSHVLCASSHNYDMGSIYVDNDVWTVIGPTEDGPQKFGTGGEIALWKSWDEGQHWTKVANVTKNSPRNHSYVRRPLYAHNDFYAFWADGNADSMSVSKLYFTDKNGSQVYEMPYRMKTDYEKPIAVYNQNSYQPFGVNLACAEFDEANLPGKYDKHYTYPKVEELDYFKDKGLKLIRFPFKWERIQHELNGELNSVELKRIKDFVGEAEKRSISVILDLHNYARRYHQGVKCIIGTNGVTLDHFADFWRRFAMEMSSFSNIYGYGLMNEPHDLGSSVSWFQMAQKGIEAIRKSDQERPIIIGGDDWSSAERWVEKSDTLKYLKDPVNNLIYEAHVYFDADASGSYNGSYDTEKGSPTRGIERVRPFVNWLKNNQLKGFVGEYGVPDDDERWLVTMDNFLNYLQSEGVNATYWAAGPWWGKYPLSLTPKGGKDAPQMKIVEKYLTTSYRHWVDGALAKAEKQALLMARHLKDKEGKLPRSLNSNGELVTSSSDWWCSGFFPGVLWYLYENNKGSEELFDYANLYTKRIEKEQFNTSTHDLGFMLYCSYGNGFRLNPTSESEGVLINGAHALSARYNPVVKCIRSWNKWRDYSYPVIIDNMMNLEMLMWAYKRTGDDTFKNIAISHANTTKLHHFREDYSSFHVVAYDLKSGKVLQRGTDQGYGDDSSWARGQAWALYGYTMMYRETGNEDYLNLAWHIADFILNHPHLPKDKIPYWDFDSPGIPDDYRDSSSAAIIASALLELSKYSEGHRCERYYTVAEQQLRMLASDEYMAEVGTNGFFILKHGVGNIPQNSELDAPLSYGDYYFIEALLRYRNY